jgi:hypothetical protein
MLYPLRASGGEAPLDQAVDESMDADSGGFSTPIHCNGKGVVGAFITHPDTTSAAGIYYFAVCWAATAAEALAKMQAGTYKRLTIPVLPKASGTGLVEEPLVLVEPGSPFVALEYVPSSGGAADEITATLASW